MQRLLDALSARYRILDVLGEGSMGVVYRAYDRLSGQYVALKRVTITPDGGADTSDDRLSLAREFRILAGLRHLHIISVLDYGFDSNLQPFYTMELLEESKTILAAGRSLARGKQLELLLQAFEALAYLHQRGVLHHDLKPENVLVADARVRLLDFGLAVLTEQQRAEDAFGTLLYMPPEILAGQHYTRAGDSYSLGVIAYELLVGHHPITTDSTRTFLALVQSLTPDLRSLADQPALAELIAQLLARNPASRPTARAVVVALRAILGTDTVAYDLAIRESYLQAATFVGRENELALLSAALDSAYRSQGSAWLISGESGVGKSRLLDELRTRALVEGFYVLRGQAVEGAGLPYQIWRNPLRSLVMLSSPTDLEASILKVIVPGIDVLLERAVPDPPVLPGESNLQRIALTITDLFKRLHHPVVLMLEDLHWSNESLLPLMLLNPLTKQLPLLILATYRNDERPKLPSTLPGMIELPLMRLSAQAIGELSRAMLGEDGSRSAIIQLLQRETEGNVFFVIEVVRKLAEEVGDINRIGQMTLPTSILPGGMHQILRRRLNKVPDWGQLMLRLAAVAGREIDETLLRYCSPDLALDRWLAACADASVIEVLEGRWRFSHDKLREALLADLQEAERTTLYRRVAVALEAIYPHDSARDDILLEFWRSAAEPRKELIYIQRVVNRDSELNFNLERNIALLERGLALASDLPESSEARMVLLALRGATLTELGQVAAAYDDLQQSLALAQQLNHAEGRLRALRALGAAGWRAGDLAGATQHLQEALRLARALNQRGSLGPILNLLGVVAALQFRLDEAQHYFQESLLIHQQSNEFFNVALVLGHLGIIARLQHDYRQSSAYCSEALAIHRRIHNHYGKALALGSLGCLAYLQSEYSAALLYAQEALTLSYESNFQYCVIDALGLYARIYVALGQWDQAERSLIEALQAAMQHSAAPPLVEVLAAYTIYVHARADYAQALTLAFMLAAHPATPGDLRQEALAPLLDALTQQLPAGEVAAAQGRATALDLAEAAARALASLARE